MIKYYDIHGMPISVERWIQLFDEERRVAFTRFLNSKVEVSTVWLGLDHNYLGDGPPLIFETMVFGGPFAGDMRRYSTLDQAREGHQWMVREVTEAMPQLKIGEEYELRL